MMSFFENDINIIFMLAGYTWNDHFLRMPKKSDPTRKAGKLKYADVLKRELDSGVFATKGEHTRQRLRISAARVLEEVGYQDLTVSAISKDAGVALGTFYVYFSDKTEVAIDVVLSFIAYAYTEAQALSRGKDEYEAIYSTNRYFAHAYGANPGLMRSFIQLQSQEPSFRELWEPRHDEWIQKLANSIRRRGPSPPVSQSDALKMAAALEGMVFSYLYAVAVEQKPPTGKVDSDPDKIAEILSLLWYRAVQCKDPPPR